MKRSIRVYEIYQGVFRVWLNEEIYQGVFRVWLNEEIYQGVFI